jgi:sugar phosphate isomerase/epimerase
MKLGVGSYTYTWAIGVPGALPAAPLTADGLLARAVELGVSIVQYCDNLPLTSLASRELDALLDAAGSRGVAFETGTRGLDEPNLLDQLAMARRIGSPFVRVVVDAPGDQPAPEETVARLAPLVPRFADAGVRIAIENHDRFSTAALVEIVERLGVEHVGICLDTVNSFAALEGPELVVERLAPYCLNLHVKDFTIRRVNGQMGFVVEGAPAGEGRLQVPWLLQRLAAARRDVNAILELWTPRAASLDETIAREADWARSSVAYLRQLLPD